MSYKFLKIDSLNNILLNFGITKKLPRLIKTYSDEIQSKVRIGKYFSLDLPAGIF